MRYYRRDKGIMFVYVILLIAAIEAALLIMVCMSGVLAKDTIRRLDKSGKQNIRASAIAWSRENIDTVSKMAMNDVIELDITGLEIKGYKASVSIDDKAGQVDSVCNLKLIITSGKGIATKYFWAIGT